MATEYELTFLDYLSIMRRRAIYLAGIFVVVFLTSIIVAVVLPPSYRSTGTIMVESQQVPDNVVQSANKTQVEERISIIKERVLTRDSLLRVANKYDLFKDYSRSLTSSELIDQMRDRVGIDLISADEMYSSQRGKSTIAFTLSFEDKRPEIAFQVAKDLTKLFLDWNIKLRTEGAAETADFISQETDKLRLEVEGMDKRIAAFKQQNNNALPEQLSFRMNVMTNAENNLREIERDYRSTQNELRSLEDPASGKGEDTPQTLPALKAEYAKLSATYNDSYPDMRILKRKIEALEKTEGDSESKNIPDNVAAEPVNRVQSKIESVRDRLNSLAEQKKMLQEKIAQNENSIMLTPKVEQNLDILIRDRDTAQKKYEEIRSKMVSAKIAESLESDNKSERFTLLETPLLPDKTFKPNRIKIIVLGFFLAIASSVGMLFIMATFDHQIRRADALVHVTGQRPLVVIPYLYIREEWARRRHLIKVTIFTTIFAVIIIAVALHFLYMPLDILLEKIMFRLK